MMNRQKEVETCRSGVSAILIVAMLFVFVVSAALTVDISYMQLVRTELRAATDAATKAGAEALQRTEDQDEALRAAQQYAELNTVAGQPFRISADDVKFGRVTANASGRYEFSENATPSNAVSIVGRVGDGARTAAIPLFFAKSLGHGDFSTSHSATASQQDVEVCLTLDRSGSMLFDLSGRDYSYPPNNPRLSSWRYWGNLWRNHLSAPNPNGSRWSVLQDAVDVFLDEAGKNDQPPRVGLVSWGADYTMPISPNTFFRSATVDYSLPNKNTDNWAQNTRKIESAIEALSIRPMMGGTNMSAGLDAAVAELTKSQASTLANKVIILLSDGVWNSGREPSEAARDARDAGITVHTISLLSNDQATLREVADITGGRFFATADAAQLRAAFIELARTLPIILTD